MIETLGPILLPTVHTDLTPGQHGVTTMIVMTPPPLFTALEVSAGDTAWVLTSASLVLLMTPALAFFYGGMVRVRSVLNMLMMVVTPMATVGIGWVLVGYSMAFGRPMWGGLIGNPLEFFGLHGVLGQTVGTIPAIVFVAFQSAFAIIAVALIAGGPADRMRFPTWVAFTCLWSLLCYFPVANWVFGTGWILNKVHAVDFAGGTAIHINAGAAALALVVVMGPRLGFGNQAMRPHNTTLVMLGAGVLWFGWFGFNAGSSLGANEQAGLVWVNTLLGAGAALLSWIAVERIRDGRPTCLGAASGLVAGLVGITPACAAVSPTGAIAIGVLCGVCCCLAVGLKYALGYDDSLDVVGVHLVGGLVGTLAIGLLADPALMPEATLEAHGAGLFLGGGLGLLGAQALGALACLAYSFVLTFVLAKALDSTMGLRIGPADEVRGIDVAEHAEVGYDLSGIRHSALSLAHPVPDHIVIPPAPRESVPGQAPASPLSPSDAGRDARTGQEVSS